MKCLKCGYENMADSKFCVSCGAPINLGAPSEPAAPTYTVPTQPVYSEPNIQIAYNPAAARLTAAAGDSLYLVLCILLSVAALFSLSVVTTLIAIFSWLTFVAAKKGNIQSKHLRVISGAVYTDYIVTKIAGILLIVLGALFMLLFIAIGSPSFMMDYFYDIIPYEYNDFLYTLPDTVFSILGIALGVVCIVVGIISIIINNLGMKKIHSFAKSVYKSVEDGIENYQNTKSVGGWLIAYSVMNASSIIALSSVEEIVSAIAAGAIAAAGIMAFLIYKKHF